jgi:hypothetical protein
MNIKGKLQHHITGKKTFKGIVKFEGDGIPQVPQKGELSLYYENGIGMLTSFFRVGENGNLEAHGYNFGLVYISEDFSEFTVAVYSRNSKDEPRTWSITDGIMITAPAKNREEALEITNKLLKEYRERRESSK